MRRRARGNVAVEAALFIPILVLLIVGMIQFGKITYQYYVLKKILYGAARELSLQQGVNFCDLANDAAAQAAIQFALTDSTGTLLIPNLTPGMLLITTACATPGDPTAPPGPCDSAGCPAISGRPDFVMVSIPEGYQVRPRIPIVELQPILLRPAVTLPFGGIS